MDLKVKPKSLDELIKLEYQRAGKDEGSLNGVKLDQRILEKLIELSNLNENDGFHLKLRHLFNYFNDSDIAQEEEIRIKEYVDAYRYIISELQCPEIKILLETYKTDFNNQLRLKLTDSILDEPGNQLMFRLTDFTLDNGWKSKIEGNTAKITGALLNIDVQTAIQKYGKSSCEIYAHATNGPDFLGKVEHISKFFKNYSSEHEALKLDWGGNFKPETSDLIYLIQCYTNSYSKENWIGSDEFAKVINWALEKDKVRLDILAKNISSRRDQMQLINSITDMEKLYIPSDKYCLIVEVDNGYTYALVSNSMFQSKPYPFLPEELICDEYSSRISFKKHLKKYLIFDESNDGSNDDVNDIIEIINVNSSVSKVKKRCLELLIKTTPKAYRKNTWFYQTQSNSWQKI